jgi:hypothetical protein
MIDWLDPLLPQIATQLTYSSIIRILIMVPVYSIGSLMSLLYYRQYGYFQILGDTYAAIAIMSFFDLLCHYLGPTLQTQQDLFQDIVPKRWTVYLFGLEIPLPVHWICGDAFARPNGSRWFKVVYIVWMSREAKPC